jgi:hypothetical protein
MVGAPAAGDAVARAHGLRLLRVGLHLVLVRGRPVLPPEQIPALVGPDGAFSNDLLAAGCRYFFSPGARRPPDELAALIDPRVRVALSELGIERTVFSELSSARG